MKSIYENEDIFNAYVTIDLCYLCLKKLNKKLGKPTSGIELLIDKATGYDAAKYKNWKKASVSFLEQIIEAKKKIEANYDEDVKTLNNIKAL